MTRWCVTGLFLVICTGYVTAQVPPRLLIPGAIPVGGGARPFRTQSAPSPRLRRPNAIPAREVRPVVEEIEEPNYPSVQSQNSNFEDEVNKLTYQAAQSSREDEEEPHFGGSFRERVTPLPFRPERPVPIAREQIREKSAPRPPPRQIVRQELRDEPLPVKQPVRQQLSRPAPPPLRPQKLSPRQQSLDDEDDIRDRRRGGPQVEIVNKFREDNEDGSITWGFETSDGTFKEETLGADCIIRGKYGYVDPDGVKREFSYETGNKCDEPEEEEEDLLPLKRENIPQSKGRPLAYSRPVSQQQSQPQYLA